MVVAVGIGAGLVPLLRNVDFAADDGMDALALWRRCRTDRAEEIAVIGHGDGGHFLLGDHLHELIDFAGAVEQRVVGVVVEVNEWSFGHRKNCGSVVGGDDYYSNREGETSRQSRGCHRSSRSTRQRKVPCRAEAEPDL